MNGGEDDDAEFERALVMACGLFPADRVFAPSVPASAETARSV